MRRGRAVLSEAVSPLRRYGTPRYPAACEIGEADLSRVPTRWRGLRAIASTIGAAAIGLKTLALGGAEANASAPAVAPTEAVPDAKRPKHESAKPVTDVCPLPPAALAGNGEGAFGCVAMNPPVILSECDALEIIEREFRKRGVELVDAPEIDGVEVPVSELEPSGENPSLVKNRAKARRANSNLLEDICAGRVNLEVPRKKRKWILDLGTRDGSVMVEYVSAADDSRWRRDPWEGSTVRAYSTRASAELAVDGFGKRAEGKPVQIGVFYDPMEHVPEEEIESFKKEAEKASGAKPGWREVLAFWSKRGHELAERRLVAQIEAFFDNLAKRGKLPGQANAPDAPSH